MKLNKRIKRDIKYNRSFYISASLLTAIAVFLLVTLYTALLMLDNGFQEVMKNGNVEDAQFTTNLPIEKEDIKYIENTYHVDLEKIQYVDIKEKDYKLRVFAPTNKVNRYELLEGEDITSDNQILLNRDFAKAHGIVIGDSFTIEGKSYIVSGLAVRPDYLYAQMETTDFYVNKATFGQVTMNQRAFNSLEQTQSYYAIVYHKDNNEEVRKYIYSKFNCYSYMSSDSNNRISLSNDIVDEYGIIIMSIIPLMFIMIAFIVAVVLGRMVKKEQKQIGTLVAMGYRKSEILRHYSVYAILPGAIGSVIGIIASILLLKPVVLYIATDYEQINYKIELHIESLLMAVFAPVILYFLTALWTVSRMLRKNTVLLLAGNKSENDKRKSTFLAKSKMSFRRKFRIRSLVANKARTIVVIMGMFVGAFVCAIGLIMIDSCDYLVNKGMDAAGSYEYQYYLNSLETNELENGEPMLATKFEVEGFTGLFTLCGTVENPKFLNLKLKTGKNLEYGKYYMTSNAAALYSIEAGEEFTFISPVSTKSYTVTVEDIIDDNTQCYLYTNNANVAELLGMPIGSYNVIISDKQLDIDKDIIAAESSKQKLKEQFDYAVNLMRGMIYMLILFGAILCIITVYLTVNMLIEENRINISMLKVLGYRPREINILILNTNHILLPFSFLLSILSCLKLCEYLFEQFIAELNLYLEPVITISSILICLATLTFSYFTSLVMLKRKILKVDMVESLKDNRE